MATSKMFHTNSDISYHNRANEVEIVNPDTNAANAERKTMLGAMCKLCMICFVEAIKIIGQTLNQHFVQGSSKLNNKRPPGPIRTRSRIIKITQGKKSWIKKQCRNRNNEPESSSTNTNMGTHTRLSRIGSQISSGSKKFGQSLNLSRRYLGRRHSYPPYRSSKLEIVLEEE